MKCVDLLKGKDIVAVLPTGFANLCCFSFLPVKADNFVKYTNSRFVTFIHLPFSVRSLDHSVASLVFMKNNSCCILRSNFK